MATSEETKNDSKKYDKVKEFKGSRYSGMKVGGAHKWYYDKGVWKERKITPEEWGIYYKTPKRRAGKAPKGSGAPVGTGYNWLIVAHQRVDKLDANSYMTYLEGKKFKVAHKRASKGKWNIKEKTQRKKVIQFLEKVIQELKNSEVGEDPYTIGDSKRIYGLEQKTKAELNEIASGMKIPNRSKMKRAELLAAIKENLNDQEKED
ncbi:MAG TPA: Rho termination factor N-terminal domain-containing protein [Salinimicrobium sp.]|nr:Rho termination factor N-terminal domain-containing protein [Salinimicrobium sp.]